MNRSRIHALLLLGAALAAFLVPGRAGAQTGFPTTGGHLRLELNGVPTPATALNFRTGFAGFLVNGKLTLDVSQMTPATRRVNTTSPLAGGGALSADLTLTCTPCLVSSGSYSNPSWLTSLAGSKISGTVASATNFTGTLAGDVTGTQGATVVQALQGHAVANISPSNEDVLEWSNEFSQWRPSEIVNSLTAGTGISVSFPRGDVTAAVDPTAAINWAGDETFSGALNAQGPVIEHKAIITSVTSYTVATTDYELWVETSPGDVTVTLPNAGPTDRRLRIVNLFLGSGSPHSVILNVSSGGTINGVSTFTMSTAGMSADVVCVTTGAWGGSVVNSKLYDLQAGAGISVGSSGGIYTVSSTDAAEGAWFSLFSGTITPSSTGVGGYSPSTAVTGTQVSCSWGIAGSGAGNVVLEVWDENAGPASVCSCTLAACTATSGGACACTPSYVTGHLYVARIGAGSSCAGTFPQNLGCNIAFH